jgi:GcrA cell cycle regulator
MNLQVLELNQPELVTETRAKYYRWTPERARRCKELCDQGRIYKEVAAIMFAEFGECLTTRAVGSQANRAGTVRQVVWTQEHHDYAVELAADPMGFSLSIVAEKINAKFGTAYTRNAVIGRLNRAGITREATKTTKPKGRGAARPILRGRLVRLSAPRTRIPEIVVQMRCAEVVPRHVSLLELGNNECHWPYGEGPFTFCGNRADGTYCAAHRLLAIQDRFAA